MGGLITLSNLLNLSHVPQPSF